MRMAASKRPSCSCSREPDSEFILVKQNFDKMRALFSQGELAPLLRDDEEDPGFTFLGRKILGRRDQEKLRRGERGERNTERISCSGIRLDRSLQSLTLIFRGVEWAFFLMIGTVSKDWSERAWIAGGGVRCKPNFFPELQTKIWIATAFTGTNFLSLLLLLHLMSPL